jgi:hypothetical protein
MALAGHVEQWGQLGNAYGTVGMSKILAHVNAR